MSDLEKKQEFYDDWISLREAAGLMHVNEKRLRERNFDGSYKHFPQIARIQFNGLRSKIFLLRSQVMEWRVDQERIAIDLTREIVTPPSVTYASALPELQKLGAHRAIRSLGLLKTQP